jgi:hypothetical protein
MHLSRSALLAALLGMACVVDNGATHVESSSNAVGDTLAVAISAPKAVPAILLTVDSATVVWTPEELGRPTGMAVGPYGRVTVSDSRHMYAWLPGTNATEAVGREGAGPGEYRSVGGMVAEADGSLIVLDSRQRRIIRFHADGTSDTSWVADRDFAHDPFLAVMDSDLVVLVGPRLVRAGEPADTLYLKLAAGDTSTTVGKLQQFVWAQSSDGILLPRDAYPPQTLIAGTATAGFAFSDGLQYDLRWWRPNARPSWLHLSRTWAAPPQSIDRTPSVEELAQIPNGEMWKRLVEQGERGAKKYSLEELELMPQGTLWVRPVDSSYVYAPTYYIQLPALRQPTRLWEVFGTDGRLLAQVRLSSMFSPKTIHECNLYGFLEGSDGSFSVATIPLKTQCMKLLGKVIAK